MIQLKKNQEELTQEVMGKISLKKDKVNLEKHVVNLSKTVVNLSQKSGVDLGIVSAKVVVVLDYSASMSEAYKKGVVQRTINRLVPLGLTFDDNGSIDVYLFSDEYKKMEDLNLSNYETYVNKVILESGFEMKGTSYAPVLSAILNANTRENNGLFSFFRKKKSPVFVLFITDGENFDKSDSDTVIRDSSKMDVFIQFIGIGYDEFRYLRELDNMPGRKRDNTGFSKMVLLDNVDDNELYTNVLEQFSRWIKGLQ